MRHRHRLSYHPSPPCLTRARQPGSGWKSEDGVTGSDRPRGRRTYDNGTPLTIELAEGSNIEWEYAHYTKVVPGGASPFGLGRQLATAEDSAEFNEFTEGCDRWQSNWAGRPLYRPRDNLAMLHGGLEKLMRMSTRNMW